MSDEIKDIDVLNKLLKNCQIRNKQLVSENKNLRQRFEKILTELKDDLVQKRKEYHEAYHTVKSSGFWALGDVIEKIDQALAKLGVK